MNSRIAIALMCLLSITLAGCPKGDKPATADASKSGPQANGPPPGEDPAGGIHDVQEAELPAGGGGAVACAAPSNSKKTKVTAGTYCVCNVGTHRQHGDSRNAEHLIVGQSVVIEPLDHVTQVQLGANAIQMVRSEDQIDLTALVSYPHTGGLDPVTHLVRITPETNPANHGVKCDPTKNVLRVSFCYKEAAGWSCGPRPGAHNGDTHVQN